MTVLSYLDDPVVSQALTLARDWCAGHTIDGAPALGHAMKVALVLATHVPDVPSRVVAAALLHDAPEYAPHDIDLDAELTARCGPGVAAIVRGLEREHHALDH